MLSKVTKSLSFFVCFIAYQVAATTMAESGAGEVRFHVDWTAPPIYETLPGYVSADLDFWTGEHNESGGDWKGSGLLSIDLQNRRLRNLAAALSPGFLRLGGTLDSVVRYAMDWNDTATVRWCEEPVMFREQPWHLCLNRSRWDEIYSFSDEANLDVVFGLSWGGISGDRFLDTRDVPAWNNTNAASFLQYSASQGYVLHAVELGEEMAPDPGTESFAHLLEGYEKLNLMLQKASSLSISRL